MSGYRIAFTLGRILPPSKHLFETVERKGLGHPDTMADLVAELFCFRYAQHCEKQFGFVPNHSADKVTLAGADTVVRLGGYDVVTPIGAYYFGKVTRHVGSVTIPVEDLFDSAVADVLTTCTRDPQVRQHTRPYLRAVVGSPIDHHPGYYNPESNDQLRSIMTTERLANDTVACAASSEPTPVERLTLDLERYLQGLEFRSLVPGTGSDIKVLAVRDSRVLDVTVCVPFHPEALSSWIDYDDRVERIRSLISTFIEGRVPEGVETFVVHLNKRDIPGRGYLAPFGTCLGKGDVGAVGRGNRFSGLITPGRAMSVEAPAGKNPVHHTGKLYTILAQWVSDLLRQHFCVDNEVIITSRVGAALTEPGSVCVNFAEDGVNLEKAESLIRTQIGDVDLVTQALLNQDPLEEIQSVYRLTPASDAP
ncbi:hypothetical protein HTZ77_24325 [Nonomuraea sp. SMC257]|uniref:Methionine adenosyltransferase n=1 Tax=Nonomuraea montanisoli TaxID=2741721 RepID=A0A7Y6IAH0_9ACTN|nr:methionine adenosyltransferase [Nonomuraea montanisoli]NUW34541.1 hypothetical protein [Nonomuraea montanisoli]